MSVSGEIDCINKMCKYILLIIKFLNNNKNGKPSKMDLLKIRPNKDGSFQKERIKIEGCQVSTEKSNP
jgi:hypothetical protein